MMLTISEDHLPVTLSVPRMTDEEFIEFCSQYPDYFVEVTASGEAILMPPNYSLTAARGLRIARALGDWADADGSGIATDSSGGFVLPNGARRAPDAAWVSHNRLATQTSSELRRFWHLCPEFLIELRPTHDRLAVLRAKMHEWIENGAELAWMIDPEAKTVEIYRPGKPLETLVDATQIVAGSPVDGFRLDMTKIWNPLPAAY